VYFIIPIAALALLWVAHAFTTVVPDPIVGGVYLFLAALGIYAAEYLTCGLVKKATGAEAFKNWKRWLVMLPAKALFFATAFVTVLTITFAGGVPISYQCGGRQVIDVPVLLMYVGINVAMAVIMGLFTRFTIKGE
jgi:hypothetical protein